MRYIWAKKAVDANGQMKWLPIKQHLLDTSFMIKSLYNHYLSEGQRRIIRTSIHGNDDDARKLVAFLGLTHDIGKCTPAFQTKRSFDQSIDNDLIAKLVKLGYWQSTNYSLEDAQSSPHALAGEALLNHYGVDVSVAGLIGGHHGKPVNKGKTVRQQIEKE